MVQTASNMMPLGSDAPEFVLTDTVTGKRLNLQELRGETATLVMFICNHCPFVKHIQDELVKLGQDYSSHDVGIIAINSNDVDTYPDDSPDKMRELALALGYAFPYLYDDTQDVARNYDATCTPDFFLFDKNLQCVYRGQLDDSRPGNNVPVTGVDLRNAIENVKAGKAVAIQQKPSVGCNIKWK